VVGAPRPGRRETGEVVSERLGAIGERLERVVRGPDAIESQLLFRVARPLLAIAKWRASIDATALETLIAALRADETTSDPAGAKVKLGAAIDELERNVLAVERVAIVKKRAPVAHALWLRRVFGVLEIAEAAIDLALEKRPDEAPIPARSSRRSSFGARAGRRSRCPSTSIPTSRTPGSSISSLPRSII